MEKVIKKYRGSLVKKGIKLPSVMPIPHPVPTLCHGVVFSLLLRRHEISTPYNLLLGPISTLFLMFITYVYNVFLDIYEIRLLLIDLANLIWSDELYQAVSLL